MQLGPVGALVAALVLAVLVVRACDVGERQKVTCDSADSCCCEYPNGQSPNMTIFSCFAETRGVTGQQICQKLNGTCSGAGGGGVCFAGSATRSTCDGSTPCCCSYVQSNPSGAIQATICLSKTLCGVLHGACA